MVAANLLKAALDVFFVIGVVVVDEFIVDDIVDDIIDDDIDDFVVVVARFVTDCSSCSVGGFVVWENRRVLLVLPCVGITGVILLWQFEFPTLLPFILRFVPRTSKPNDFDVGLGVRCTPDNTKKPSAKQSCRGTETDNKATKKARRRDIFFKQLFDSSLFYQCTMIQRSKYSTTALAFRLFRRMMWC